MDIHDDLAATLSTMDAFAQLLTTENEALAAMRLDQVGRLQPQKAELAEAYRRRVKALHGRREELDELAASEEDVRERIAQSWERLANAVTTNLAAIERARGATHTVVELLVDATRRAFATTNGYGLSAPVPAPGAKGTLSVSIDRKL